MLILKIFTSAVPEIKPTPDKTAIKAAIEAGQEVPGAHIETKINLVIK